MSIKIDLYDLFAYTIPGGFYLSTIIYLCQLLDVIHIDIRQLNDFSSWLIFIGLVISYAMGHVFDPVAYRWQTRFSGGKHIGEKAFKRFRSGYGDIKVNFRDTDAPILRIYVKKHCPEVGEEIDKHGATRTMLRNISLNFLILAMILFIHIPFTGNLLYAVGGLLASALALISMNECLKFARWFRLLRVHKRITSPGWYTDAIHRGGSGCPNRLIYVSISANARSARLRLSTLSSSSINA